MKRVLLTLCSLALLTPAFAASVADLRYKTNNADTITITDCDYDASGNLVIPATIGGIKVTEIGEVAFKFCSRLTSVTIPEGVTEIGWRAFADCSSLTSVKIPEGVTSIGEGAFSGCESLTSVKIPKGVTSIGYGAFGGCESLTSVTIPSSVTSIGEGAFSYCESLTSVTIPKGVTEIGRSAFAECTAMKEMIFKGPPPHVEPLSDDYKQFFKHEGFSNPETLPATKGYYLPEHAEAWEKVLGGETGEWNNLQMEPITEEILAKLKAAEAQDEGTVVMQEASVEDLRYSTNDNDTITITYCNHNASGDLIIPTTIDGKKVTEIGWRAFYECSDLTSVTIPEGVTEIGSFVFDGCSNLTLVAIPEGVTKIGEGAFVGCTAIEEMIFKGPPPYVEPLADGMKQLHSELFGISNPRTLPATKGYYLPEHAKDWEKVLGGETGEWNNLQMKPISLR